MKIIENKEDPKTEKVARIKSAAEKTRNDIIRGRIVGKPKCAKHFIKR